METDASSLTEDQIDHILTQYHSGKITIGCAASIAGIPLWEMIAIAAGKGIPFQYSLDDLNEDMLAGGTYASRIKRRTCEEVQEPLKRG
jgi:predicted HTH domain antitoxin